MWHYAILYIPSFDFLTANYDRDLNAFRFHAFKLSFKLNAFRAPRQIALYRLVDKGIDLWAMELHLLNLLI